MKKSLRTLTFISPYPSIYLLVCLLCSCSVSQARYSGGTGDPNDPYLISTPENLNEIGTHTDDRNKHFLLISDINLSDYDGQTFNMIGNFQGVFDGNGHTISNFTYNYTATSQNYVGLFKNLNAGAAEIKNLIMANPDVNGEDYSTFVGAVVGYLTSGTIRNCVVTGGSVRGHWPTGGLVGESNGQIINCHTDIEVWGEIWVGGLVGSAESGLIQNCSSSANVHGEQYVGGLVGENSGQIIDSFATGIIKGSYYAGGFVGENDGSISRCFSSAKVIATNSGAGGFTGRNIRGVISDCYSSGKVFAGDNAAGFARLNWNGIISNCYSTGYIEAENNIKGFLLQDLNGITSNCFWDKQTSGTSTSAAGTAKTTAQMKTAATFISVGWDFTTPVWQINDSRDYPRLFWQSPANNCLYVDPKAAGKEDGSSWQNAFNYLQDTLVAAAKSVDVNEIRVAAGTYCPDRSKDYPSGTADRLASFELFEGVSVKGGYAGLGQPDPNVRDFQLYETILSGDLLANDSTVTDARSLSNDPNRTDNSYSVVSSLGNSSSTIIDGFTITAGNADGADDWPLEVGGGMFIQYGGPQVRNCSFIHNLASVSGPGLFILIGGCSISDCQFSFNFLPGSNVQPCGGGALGVMWGDGPALTTIINTSFVHNESYEWGGAISNFWSNLEVTDCTFSHNVTYDSHDTWSSPEGGAIYCTGGKLLAQNCLFSANAAKGESYFTSGGAMFFNYKCQPTLWNCTFVDNSADFLGGAIYGYDDINTLTIKNCIFWNNFDKNGSVESSQIDECNEIVIDYSCVQGWTGALGGAGNTGSDPCFARLGFWNTNDTPGDTNDDFWTDGDYHLKSEAGRWQPSVYSELDPTSDGFINLSDFAAFAALWRQKGGSIPADMDLSGTVDFYDLVILLDNYLSGYKLGVWVHDDVTSPCIDAGDTSCDWTAELWPHGKRINMGAFGNMPQASMSLSTAGNIANLDNDPLDNVNLLDLELLIHKWLYKDVLLPADINRDGTVNLPDYAILAEQWMSTSGGP
jgi:hypothetical protein